MSVAVGAAPATLAARYRPAHLSVFTPEEIRRFARGMQADVDASRSGDEAAWTRVAPVVAWELLYRVEPELFERLVAGERLHPRIWDRLPARCETAVEVGAGSGRLTVGFAPRCASMVAVEPAAPLRTILEAKVRGLGNVEAVPGFFDELPVEDAWAELVVACSSFTPNPAHGGEAGLQEMRRVCAPGGRMVIVWPSEPEWLCDRGWRYESFPGEMAVEFAGVEDAVELARIFYPDAADEVERRAERVVPYEVLGVNAPRDLCWKSA